MARHRYPRIINAKRPGKCAETGEVFKAGDRILLDYGQALAYGPTSRRFLQAAQNEREQAFNAAHNMPDANW